MEKRKSLFLFWAALCCMAAHAQRYTLKGEIKGLPDTVVVRLMPVSHTEEKPVGETTAIGGRFEVRGEVQDPLAVRLIVKGAYGSILLMLEEGDITLKAEAVSSDHRGTASYSFDNVRVEGSPSTLRLRDLVSVRDTFNVLHSEYTGRYRDFSAKLGQARRDGDRARLDSLSNTAEGKALNAEEADFFRRVETSYNRLMLDNKDTFWGPLLMVELTAYLSPDMKSIYEQFSEEAKASRYGRMVKDELYPAGREGEPVPSFAFRDDKGKEVTLQSLSAGKKYVLIDFWASWCRPCRNEIPNLKRLYAAYADKGFQIVSISIDKKEVDWRKALEEEQLPWPNFRDMEGVSTVYKVRSIPAMFLVDDEGIMVGEGLRGEALADKLKELLD